MNFEQAVHLLNMHKHQVHGIGKRPGLVARRRADEEVLATILRKLKAMQRGLALGDEDRARSEREWARRRARN